MIYTKPMIWMILYSSRTCTALDPVAACRRRGGAAAADLMCQTPRSMCSSHHVLFIKKQSSAAIFP